VAMCLLWNAETVSKKQTKKNQNTLSGVADCTESLNVNLAD